LGAVVASIVTINRPTMLGSRNDLPCDVHASYATGLPPTFWSLFQEPDKRVLRNCEVLFTAIFGETPDDPRVCHEPLSAVAGVAALTARA